MSTTRVSKYMNTETKKVRNREIYNNSWKFRYTSLSNVIDLNYITNFLNINNIDERLPKTAEYLFLSHLYGLFTKINLCWATK